MSAGKTLSLMSAIAVLIASAGSAFAGDSNGNLQVRVGVTGVLFDDSVRSLRSSSAGDLKAGGADATVPNVVVPTATITYFFNKNLAIEAVCCAAYVQAEGTKGLSSLGKLADAWVLPAVVTLQYRFDRIAGIQPTSVPACSGSTTGAAGARMRSVRRASPFRTASVLLFRAVSTMTSAEAGR
jgi:outer membrane protein W